MIKVRDFAKECGCTPQNIYLHLKNYAAELEGHVFKERRTTYLDEEACEFIRSVMYPKMLADSEVQRQVAELMGKLSAADHENARLQRMLTKTEGERDKALLELGSQQKLLAENTQKLDDLAERLDNEYHRAELAKQMYEEAKAQLDEAASLPWYKKLIWKPKPSLTVPLDGKTMEELIEEEKDRP